MNRLYRRLLVRSLEDRLVPATFTVMNLNDSGADSLRDCVSKANSAAGADNINFQAGLTGTITLTSGEVAISQAVTIDGPGASVLTISGNNASRIFNTATAPAAAVMIIDDLTFTNGKGAGSGGAFVGGDEAFLVSRCDFVANQCTGSGGAVSLSGGNLNAIDCRFLSNTASVHGGAVSATASNPTLSFTRCTLSGNTASNAGGAIYARNNGLSIDSSTISSNTSQNLFGGGVCVNALSNSSTAVITNSTLSGNSAALGGGAFYLTGTIPTPTLTVLNSTITANTAPANGGGLRATGSNMSIALESSIVSGNFCVAAPDISSPGSVTVKTSAVGSGTGFSKTDLTGNLAFGTDLKLGLLQNNGGPTLTHALTIGSPAINQGSNPAGMATDQRGAGFPRVFGTAADMGAFEVQTFGVSNANDGGAGSLRQAVLDANAFAGANTILFDPAFFNVPRTIALTSGEIAINDSVIVTGPGASLVTVDPNSKSRVFNIAAGLDVTLSGMTLTKAYDNLGSSGGAILIGSSTVTLNSMTITNSSAAFSGGAVAALAGKLVVADSTFTGNKTSIEVGGAIAMLAGGALTVARTSISGNTSVRNGGGLFVAGTLTMTDSTVTGNRTFNNFGGAGLALDLSGTALIRNSTLSGNDATGPGGAIQIISGTGPLTIQNSTITNNSTSSAQGGGGIARTGGTSTLTLTSTIISGDFGSVSSPEIFTGGTANLTDCLLGSASGITTPMFAGTTAALVGKSALLGSLANNGGPTQTHSLLSGSPAIDTGSNPASLTTDQRGAGFPRVSGSAIDIGALETQPTTFVVTNDNNSGVGSLRQALLNANANGGPDTITFDTAFFNMPRVITLSSGQLNNTGEITVIGPGLDLCTISGGGVSRILDTQQAHGNLPVNISGLTFAFGQLSGTDDGAAIFAQDQNLTLSKCAFVSNAATRRGGAISIVIGSLTAIDCTFTNNVATNNGGAISASASDVTLRRCTISGNTAGNNGGGAYFYNVANLLIEDCTFSSNHANSATGGAALNVRNGGTSQMVLRNSTISGNSSGSEGGGVAISSDVNLVVQNSTVTANSAGSVGGGIFGTSALIASSIVFGNQASVAAPEIAATTVNASTSLIGSKTGVSTFNADSFTDSKIGVNPLLGALANNGGPTLTHSLLAGSPALNNGSNPAMLTNDQRGAGFVRVANGAVDIGAYESQSLTLVVLNASDSGAGSLRQALSDADVNPLADTVTFDPAFFNVPRTILLSSQLSISGAITIIGPGPALCTVSGNNITRVLSLQGVPTDTPVNISGLTITGGSATSAGGIQGSNAALTLTNCVITGNKATQLGAGVDSTRSLNVIDCVISNNINSTSSATGGGIRFFGTNLTVTRSTISGNSANRGGGIYAYGFLTLDSVTISGNTASGAMGGGGIVQKSLLFSQFRNSTISGNIAPSGMGGGVLFTHAGTFPDFQNCTITGNSATTGGGIAVTLSGTVDLVSSIISGNSATTGPDLYTPDTVNAIVSLVGSSAGVTTFTADSFTTTNLGKSVLLGPLADNGGPTQTHALLSGSPAINAGSNPAMLPNDQRGAGFARSVGQTDIGAFEVQSVAAKVTSVQIHDGSPQRSRVTSLVVTFDQTPVFAGSPAAGFQLKRQSDNAVVTLNAVPSGNTVTLTFTGGPVESTSLADGRYTLTALASQMINLDGDGNGTIGGDYILASTPLGSGPPSNIYRIFGDATGDGNIAANDFIAFRQFFNGMNPMFDFDNDGAVAASDFVQFRLRFNGSI